MVRHELQLVGLTAMFIAAKFEEMYAPEIHDFVYMSDKAYTKKEILRMELRLLKALDFSLGRPIPLHFLRRYTFHNVTWDFNQNWTCLVSKCDCI